MTERVAFVTGGMGGIGTAICRRLAGNGVKVVAGCLPGYDRKDEWLDRLRSEGLQVFAAEGNVEDYESCADMMYRIRPAVGQVDILVNAAGITRDGVFKRMSPNDWYAVINTNLNSVFNVTRQVIEGMMERGWGRTVNISSVNALKGQFGQTNYSAAKAGMHGFTKSLAQEVVKRAVTVNTNIPLGGGKGGIIVDPSRLSPNEKEHLCRGWVQQMVKNLRPRQDVPAPDVGTTPQMIGLDDG